MTRLRENLGKMGVVVVTGSAGLIGAEAVRFLARQGFDVVGIDNDMRRVFFGNEASTAWSRQRLEIEVKGYRHTTRLYCPDAVFTFTSTNKVYGDAPNVLPLVEHETRWEVSPEHPFAAHGIDETMSVDHCLHSLFGASKLAADVVVQEYGRYFGLKTACFRGGCLTGPGHSGTMLHGFLAYLVKCAVTGEPYTVFGYKGKQVRDNIHSWDLVNAFWHFMQAPRAGAVYNIGGSRHSNCSMIEAIASCERLTGRPMNWSYSDQNRTGDHIWWISDVRRFQSDYPNWHYRYDVEAILAQIYEELAGKLKSVGD